MESWLLWGQFSHLRTCDCGTFLDVFSVLGSAVVAQELLVHYQRWWTSLWVWSFYSVRIYFVLKTIRIIDVWYIKIGRLQSHIVLIWSSCIQRLLQIHLRVHLWEGHIHGMSYWGIIVRPIHAWLHKWRVLFDKNGNPLLVDKVKKEKVVELLCDFVKATEDYHVLPVNVAGVAWSLHGHTEGWIIIFVDHLNFGPFLRKNVVFPQIVKLFVVIISSSENVHAFIVNAGWVTVSSWWLRPICIYSRPHRTI